MNFKYRNNNLFSHAKYIVSHKLSLEFLDFQATFGQALEVRFHGSFEL